MRGCSSFVLLFLAVDLAGTNIQTSRVVEDEASPVALLVGQLVRQHLAGCRLVLATTQHNSSLSQHINRRISDYSVGGVVVEVQSLFSEDQFSRDRLLQELWGDVKFTCRALILHLTNSELGIRFLEESGVWSWPNTGIVIVGYKSQMEVILLDPSLRNAIHLLYFALHNHQELTPKSRIKTGASMRAWSEHAEMYRRCLYCDNGEVDIKGFYQWHPTSGIQHDDQLFTRQVEDFMGHKFQIRALNDFPLSGFRRNSDRPGTTLTPVDSLDARMLHTFAAHANFTYEVREPPDGQYGVEQDNGNWTGTVGVLQHQQADFSMGLTLTPTRQQVVQYSTVYTRDAIVIISLKPSLLPQHLAITRPFTGVIWLMLTVSIILCAIGLWLLQRTWSSVFSEHRVHLTSAFFYSWSVLMQNWTADPPVNASGRVLVGVWLLSCLILTTAYRSSLVAHLIVQDKDAEINTFQDLVARDGWQWGTSRVADVLSIYFRSTPEPGAQEVFKHMQFAPKEEQFRRVLAGGYSYIFFKFPGLSSVAASYTNKHGYTPLHFSRTEYPLLAGEGWGFRRGAPIRFRITRMMQQLVEGGLIDYWLDDIIDIHIRTKSRTKDGEANVQEHNKLFEVDERQRVLGMQHMQGAVYIIFLGISVAALILMGEFLANCCPSIQ